ncbi:hypothetical protein QAD02_023034 [Eretmocerus hayati]|uniref:Uncharacterized protein n=1 Tax=Eretmocerus hayati TaxID=131215 RepID=A0ACC2PZK5_9HYME|nr:hypothetical protein QAD02_023034 [Eretmocerus hayati]
MDFLQFNAEEISATDLNGVRQMRNFMHNCIRDILQPYLQALHAPPHMQSKFPEIITKSSQKSKEFRKNGNDLYTKKVHDEMDHKMILYFYTKSIAFALRDSEELALAYSNRSVLWMHVKNYHLCLIDVQRALKITKCIHLRTKLLARKAKCSNLKQSNRSQPKTLKFPAFQPSKLVPCAADSIALVHNERYGRHYVATRDIRAGEVVLSEESPYIAVKNDQIYLVCSHCLAFAWAGIPCEFCALTIYCSETCKEKAWNQYHDIMCSKLSILQYIAKNFSEVEDIVSMSTRIIDIFSKKEGIGNMVREAKKLDQGKSLSSQTATECDLDCRKFRTLYSLSNAKIINEKEQYSLFTIRDKLTYIMNANSFRFAPIQPDELSNFCPCDNTGFCLNKRCSNRGSIIGPCSSLANHSCVPNVVQIFLPGPKIIFLTETKIKKGEQVSKSRHFLQFE